MILKVALELLFFFNLLFKRKIISFWHVLSSQRSVSLRTQCAAAIITLTQMHIAILWVLCTWGKRARTI